MHMYIYIYTCMYEVKWSQRTGFSLMFFFLLLLLVLTMANTLAIMTMNMAP